MPDIVELDVTTTSNSDSDDSWAPAAKTPRRKSFSGQSSSTTTSTTTTTTTSAVAAATATNNNTSSTAALPTATSTIITSTGASSIASTSIASTSTASTSTALSSVPSQGCGSKKAQGCGSKKVQKKLPGSKASTNVLDVLQSKCPNVFKKHSEYEVFCKECRSVINIRRGGTKDAVRHSVTSKHKKAVEQNANQHKLSSMHNSGYVQKQQCQLEAEVMLCQLVAKKNISFVANSELSQ